MPKSLLLDYGSLAENTQIVLSTAQENYETLRTENISENNKYYCKFNFGIFKMRHSAYTTVKFTQNDFQITVHQYGIIHRSVEITLNDNATQESQDKFTALNDIAHNISGTTYDLWHFNCVTSVAKILAFIDPSITNNKTNLISPLKIDTYLQEYLKKQVIQALNK